jgi:hypothetical protein
MLAEGIIRVEGRHTLLYPVLLFKSFEIFLSLREIFFRTEHFFRLVIQDCAQMPSASKSISGLEFFVIRTDQVSVLEIETIELIACLLGVVHVLVDHECSALRVVGDTLADLPITGEKTSVSDGTTGEMGGSRGGFTE